MYSTSNSRFFGGGSHCGSQFETSPQRERHQKIRQEGLLKTETHEVYLVDDNPLSTMQLQYSLTPPKKHLMIVPKKGHGSKMAVYANYGTGPLLVIADLLDTLLQRLTHRVRVLLWAHCKDFGEPGGFTTKDLIKQVKSLSTKTTTPEDGNIENVTYQELVRIFRETCEGAGSGGEKDEGEADYYEDEEIYSFCEDEPDEVVESLDLNTLQEQYESTKQEVKNGSALNKVTSQWLHSLLQLAECGLLISGLQSPSDVSPISAATLRAQLMNFLKSNAKADRIQAAHLFGSLLSRHFLPETSNATEVEEDNCPNVRRTTKFFFPREPSKILTMEQPLYAPKAFSCNMSKLEDREVILDDIWEDRERSLRTLQEDVSKVPELLTVAIRFWQDQVATLKAKRKRKRNNLEAKSVKKPHPQG